MILSRSAVEVLKGEAHAEPGGRILWARFAGELQDLLAMTVYIPHRGRSAPPFQDEKVPYVDPPQL
eukprot:SAG11_NODE_99_length_16913_cov_41.552813_17_plen_66_part_00